MPAVADIDLQDTYLRAAAELLIDAAAAPLGARTMPMLRADTYTGIGPAIGACMQAASLAAEAISDAAGAAAIGVNEVMSASAHVDSRLAETLGYRHHRVNGERR